MLDFSFYLLTDKYSIVDNYFLCPTRALPLLKNINVLLFTI